MKFILSQTTEMIVKQLISIHFYSLAETNFALRPAVTRYDYLCAGGGGWRDSVADSAAARFQSDVRPDERWSKRNRHRFRLRLHLSGSLRDVSAATDYPVLQSRSWNSSSVHFAPKSRLQRAIGRLSTNSSVKMRKFLFCPLFSLLSSCRMFPICRNESVFKMK